MPARSIYPVTTGARLRNVYAFYHGSPRVQPRHDMLTGLPNRVALNEELARTPGGLGEHDGVALLFLDLDRFKEVNDALGHKVGDALLVEVAQRLRSCLRTSDIVARVGGDEFVVMLRSMQPLEAAEMVASKIIGSANEPFRFEAHEFRVGISVGIAVSSASAIDGETLLSRADLALYAAKIMGQRRTGAAGKSCGLRASGQARLDGCGKEDASRRAYLYLLALPADALGARCGPAFGPYPVEPRACGAFAECRG